MSTDTQTTIQFTVYGDAKPAGSKRAMPIYRKGGGLMMRPNGKTPVIVVTDDNPKAKSWQQEVKSAARQAFSGELLRGPLKLTLRFHRPRPLGHYGATTLNKKGRDTPFPVSKPDVLKLARGIEDALTNVVWNDDAQIVTEVLEKRWGEPARVEIEIETV